MTKRISYTVGFKFKVVELADAITSNRNAGNELGINEKLLRDWRKKRTDISQTTKSKQRKHIGQNLRYLDTPVMPYQNFLY